MMKNSFIRIQFCLGLLLLLSTNVFAAGGSFYYYRDCEVRLSSQSTGKGLVYVGDHHSHKNIFLETAPAQTAQFRACLSAIGQTYRCRLIAYPNPGYVLDGFVTKSDYMAGKTSSKYFLKSIRSLTIKSGDEFAFAKVDTLKDFRSDPTQADNYEFSAKTTCEYYAIFRPEVAKTVDCPSPGSLRDATVKAKATEADKLIIKGKIDSTDIKYLASLVRVKKLVKIDLSGASISKIPDQAFYSCTSLNEVKLPASGLQRIGKQAFYHCYSLKTTNYPKKTIVEPDAFHGCFGEKNGSTTKTSSSTNKPTSTTTPKPSTQATTTKPSSTINKPSNSSSKTNTNNSTTKTNTSKLSSNIEWNDLVEKILILEQYGGYSNGKEINSFKPTGKNKEELISLLENGILGWQNSMDGNRSYNYKIDKNILHFSNGKEKGWIRVDKLNKNVIFTVDNQNTYRYFRVYSKCERCGAKGQVGCDMCKEQGFSYGVEDDIEECPYCYGTGQLSCKYCSGNGVIEGFFQF